MRESLGRTLLYADICLIHMQMEMGPKIGWCPIPLWMESIKFGQRSNPFWVHKWPIGGEVWSRCIHLWLLTRSCQPWKLYLEIFFLANSPTFLNQTSSGCTLCLNNDDDDPFGIAQLTSYTFTMVSLGGIMWSMVQWFWNTLQVSLSITLSIP